MRWTMRCTPARRGGHDDARKSAEPALLVIDVQNGVMAHAYERDRVIKNIDVLAQRARASGVPVIWVQDCGDNLAKGTEAWEYVPELQRGDSEPLVHKRYGDAFEDTELDKLLAERGVGKLIVSGAQTDACIPSTIHGAFVRGYDVTLVGDAHTTEDLTEYGAPPAAQVITHTNLYWQEQAAPGRRGDTVDTAEIRFE